MRMVPTDDPADRRPGQMASQLTPQPPPLDETDRLIVDAEIYESTTAISSRDNPVGQRFAFGPLASLGVTQKNGHPRDVAARLIDTINEAQLNWVGAGRKDNGNGSGCRLCRKR